MDRKRQSTTVEGAARFPAWAGGAAAVLSAGLFMLSSPGMPMPWLAWVAFVPLFFALRFGGFRRGFFSGALCGWLIWYGSVWWLYAPLRDILGMGNVTAVLVTMGGCLLPAFPYIVAGGVVTKWIRVKGVSGAAAAAAVFTLATTWLVFVFDGNIAHWQYRYPAALQVLELGGVPLLLFAIYWVNWLLADALWAFRTNRRAAFKSVGVAAGVVGLVFGYGGVRLWQFDRQMEAAVPESWVTVGAIQPNIPIAVPDERQPAPDAAENTFFTAMEQANSLAERHPGIDLLVLPENPELFLFNDDANRRGALGRTIGATGIPVLLNVDGLGAPGDSGESPTRFNIAVFVDANRDLAGSYTKIKRLPLVEYLPGEAALPWLRKLVPASLRVVAGPGPEVFDLSETVRVIPLICYEGTMPGFTRDFVREGGNLIVNQTNDSWFLRTRASEIHLALALCRSVENRVPMVRVTNGGVGAHIQANGRIVPGSKTELFVRVETAFPLYVPPRRSVYSRIGDTWLAGLVVYLAGFLWVNRRASRHGDRVKGGE